MLPFMTETLMLHLEELEARALVMRGGLVVRWASLPIPKGVITVGVVTNPRVLADVLLELFKKVKPGRARPLVSLSGLHPVVRVLTLPRLKRNLLAEAIHREMARELPSPIDHYHLSWKVLESSNTETSVYALAVPAGQLDSYMSAFKRVRLSPKCITLEAFAVACALDRSDAIIIGMKDTGFSIVVLIDGIPATLRDFTYPRDNLSIVERVTDLGLGLRPSTLSRVLWLADQRSQYGK